MPETPIAPHDVAAAGLCIGCGACASGKEGLGWDDFGQLKPHGDFALQPSPHFAQICPFSPQSRNEDEIAREIFPHAPRRDAQIGSFESAYVGHVIDGDFRARGSSGGMVSWVAAELLAKGLIDGVAHVAPCDPQTDHRFFAYRISRSAEEIQAAARSRYYPVELSGVLDEIRAVPGRYALVGVPCFIKAVHLLRAHDRLLQERIAFTLGLFCGHMKSARFVESFAWQMNTPIDQVRAVEYRRKNHDRPANWYTAHLTLADGGARWRDWWDLVDGDWGAGFFQNSACDYCDDVVAETADIAFGDAWVEPYSSDGRGANVVIVRKPQLRKLVETAISDKRIELREVDGAFIASTQAAGLRQRREGLAYRLRTRPPALPLRKRVAAGGEDLPFRRKLIYASRRRIAAASHRVFRLARAIGWPALYLHWARISLRTYQALTYFRGRLGRLVRHFERTDD